MACAGSEQSTDSTETEREAVAGGDRVFTVFDYEHIYFGDENRRSVDLDVTLPGDGLLYEAITLNFDLNCPTLNRCDPWDRVGWLGVVENAGEESERVIELHRFITPYGVGSSWNVDVTNLRPVLTGDVTFRVFIDTWVGPGSQYGDGWSVSAELDFKGGIPERIPVAVEPVLSATRVVYGNPASPTSPAHTGSIEVPAGASQASLVAFITGHGQGNHQNCAEFCAKTHDITVGTTRFEKEIWRDDCATTAAPNQQGNWQPGRAGWCPGAAAHGWTELLPEALTPGQALDVAYGVEAYENTCSPDNCEPSSCVFGNPCEYDGGMHTEPNYLVSLLVVFYE
jgi:hypothetical protein